MRRSRVPMGHFVLRVKDFEELDVYLFAVELQQEIYELTRRFPNDERYSLTDQIRRSSRSIGANIAEAWANYRDGELARTHDNPENTLSLAPSDVNLTIGTKPRAETIPARALLTTFGYMTGR